MLVSTGGQHTPAQTTCHTPPAPATLSLAGLHRPVLLHREYHNYFPLKILQTNDHLMHYYKGMFKRVLKHEIINKIYINLLNVLFQDELYKGPSVCFLCQSAVLVRLTARPGRPTDIKVWIILFSKYFSTYNISSLWITTLKGHTKRYDYLEIFSSNENSELLTQKYSQWKTTRLRIS